MENFAELTAIAALSAACVACVGTPGAPPSGDDLSRLYRAYEEPTAELPVEHVRPLLDAAVAALGPHHALAGLHFVRDGLAEANRGLATRLDLDDLELEGRVEATVLCPGPGAPPPSANDGRVLARLGVRASHLQRSFGGTLDGCRFSLVTAFGEAQRLHLDAEFSADFGAHLRLGSPLPAALLVHLRNVAGTSESSLGAFDLARDEYHFRLTADDALEVLLDSVTLAGSDFGSVVVVLAPSGFVGIRERRGLWACGDASTPCVLY
ncbi:MAG TPA: hypothetical protein VFZ53_22525 [Polyangiaceae bacterium]